jgi:integral membrane sensor signal transduction histidine kinase
MNKKHKTYIPPKHTNPLFLSKKIKELEEKILLHSKNMSAISQSFENHLSILSSFARHDIKNSIQSIDSIISANTLEELTQEHIDSLKLNLKMIRENIDNFSELVPYGKNESFDFKQLIKSIELLNREHFYSHRIEFIKEILADDLKFYLPFQSVLQMINNIVINAIKAFELDKFQQRRKIKISTCATDKFFQIRIFDNAAKIPFDNINCIFDYGVSTTGGSGIGLYHAKYLCEQYKGSIEVFQLNNDTEYTKYFSIKLPITKQ